MRSIVIYSIFLMLFSLSCGKEDGMISNDVTGEGESLAGDWRSNPEFGYHKSRQINGFNIAVTYIPEIFEAQEYTDSSGLKENSVRFIMEIESDGEHSKGNFLYKGVDNRAEFTQNVEYFNFSIIEDVHVKVNGIPFKTVLCNMENTYNLSDKRKIHFVAVPNSKTDEVEASAIQHIEFIYDDYVLGVGMNKFTFKAEDFKPVSGKLLN